MLTGSPPVQLMVAGRRFRSFCTDKHVCGGGTAHCLTCARGIRVNGKTLCHGARRQIIRITRLARRDGAGPNADEMPVALIDVPDTVQTWVVVDVKVIAMPGPAVALMPSCALPRS